MATKATWQPGTRRAAGPAREAAAADMEDTLETAPVEAVDTLKAPEAVSAPVFVDASGRRRRWIRRAAVGLGGILCAYGVAVALSFLGGPMPPGALLPIPGLPGASAPKGATASPGVAARGATPTTSGGVLSTASGSALKTPTPSSAPTSGLSPLPSPSASPSPTARKPTVPPGQVVKSASPSASGHRR